MPHAVSSDSTIPLSEVEQFLEHSYTNHVSAEFNYIESEHEREWLTQRFEKGMADRLDSDAKRQIAELLIKSQAWDNFLATKFPTVKRYGAEGAEAMMAFFRQIFASASADEMDHVVLGMPHRGKLNLLTTMLDTRPVKIFHKFRGNPEFPGDAKAMCDIASHFRECGFKRFILGIVISTHTRRFKRFDCKRKEAARQHAAQSIASGGCQPGLDGQGTVEATVAGRRSIWHGSIQSNGAKGVKHSGLHHSLRYAPLLSLIIFIITIKTYMIQLHGDAAFAGQGINQEMLMMAGTPHFDVGGTIHMIVNNQVGFTTPGDRGRVTRYSSDLAKSIMAPVFHVNGDDPEVLFQLFSVERRKH